MTTQRLVIVGPNLPRKALATFHVHAEGCLDLSRGWLAPYVDDLPAFEAECLLDVEAFIYDFAPDENEGYELGDYIDEFHFSPCVKLPRDAS